MILKELTSDLGHATVILSYDKIRDLNNLLYEIGKDNKEKLSSLSRQFNALQLLTKDGGLQFLKVDWKLS